MLAMNEEGMEGTEFTAGKLLSLSAKTTVMFPADTEKSLNYYDTRSQRQGTIAVRIDGAGVHTIRQACGGGEKIEHCTDCFCGIFHIGAEAFFFAGFDARSLPAAQPQVQGKCPICLEQD
jgi:hypothetical protein